MIDRRELLKRGALGLGGLLVPGTALRLLSAGDDRGILRAAASPAVTPFSMPLRIPSVLQPVTAGGVDGYEITMRRGTVEALPGKLTEIWGYEGTWPGPTIIARPGRPVRVLQRNELDVETTIHLHGGHVASEMDGQPNLALAPNGGEYLYEYPNDQLPTSLWYHDHAMHATARNIYQGLAGSYLIVDAPGDADLGLPVTYGVDDVPLMLQDRSFDESGQLVYPATAMPHGFVGDVFCVNGVAQPFLEVQARPYRFRLTNASNFRIYELAVSGAPAHQVGSDGGLLARPVSIAALPNRVIRLGVSERAEIVVDFRGLTAGAKAYLHDGGSGKDLVEFRIAGATAGASWNPASGLTTIEELGGPVRTRRIVLSFDSAMGMWVLDGKHFDPNRIDARPRLGTTEVWELFNDNTGGKTSMTHPFHMHLVQFRVLERGRDGVFVSPPANERGWKDTVRIEPGETVRFAARFGEFTGNYMYHCHIFEHEDHSMMAQMRVVDLARFSGIGRVGTAAAASAATFSPGVSAVFVSTSDNFPDALAAGPVAAGKGPVLLTSGGSLPTATRAEIERLRPAKAFVLGGPSVVPAAVEEELRSLVPVVERLAGNDRYETAAAVAAAFFTRPVAIAYVASGRGFADALAGGAAAASLGGPMLLTEANALPPATGAALRNLAPGRIVLLGGPLAVGEAVENALREIAPTTRISGGDRYATAAAVVRDAFQGPVPALAVATGEAFPDALAGVPVASSLGGPLVLVPKSAPLPADVRALIESLRPGAIRVLGGEGAVPAEVEEALAELL